MARAATRLQRQADVFPIALRGLGIFQTAPPAGVRVPRRQRRALPAVLGAAAAVIVNGFVQSLVGLYDFAALTGDATARALFDDGDLAAREGGADVRHRRLVAVLARDRSAASPTSATTSCCATSSPSCASARPTAQYCSAEQHFTAYLTTPPALEVLPRTLQRQEVGQAALQALEDLRDQRDVKRGEQVVATINPGVLGRGTKTLNWTAPKKTGAYDGERRAPPISPGNKASRVR